MFDRLIHLWNVIQTSWEEDKAARGAGKMTVGAILIYEGVFGSIRKRKNRRAGIIGSIIGVIIGFILITISYHPSIKIEDPGYSVGVVKEHRKLGKDEDGDYRYAETIEYNVSGRIYQIRSKSSSTKPIPIGREVEIKYDINNPEKAYRKSGIEGNLRSYAPIVTRVIGYIMLLSSIISFMVSVILLYFGIKFFREGYKDRKESKEKGNFIHDFLSLFSKLRSGKINIEDTAAGKKGSLS